MMETVAFLLLLLLAKLTAWQLCVGSLIFSGKFYILKKLSVGTISLRMLLSQNTGELYS
jgi:uncharacterized membrane protein YgdD (TMEM256/DUF423 family)